MSEAEATYHPLEIRMILCIRCEGRVDAKPTEAPHSKTCSGYVFSRTTCLFVSLMAPQSNPTTRISSGVKSPRGLGGGRARSSGGLRRGAVDADAGRKQAKL